MAVIFICAKEPEDAPEEVQREHATKALIQRCVHCGEWAVAGYRCECGNEDKEPASAMRLSGHGKGECT